MLLSEEPPSWLGILAKSCLVSECMERACVRWRLHVFAINLEFFSPYTLGFSCGGVRDNLTHYVYLERELEFLQGFDSLPSHLARKIQFFFSFLLHSWDIMREDKEWRSCGVQSKEHRGFVEQEEEECLLVNDTFRWIVMRSCWIGHGICHHLVACKQEFKPLSFERKLLSLCKHKLILTTTKKQKRGRERERAKNGLREPYMLPSGNQRQLAVGACRPTTFCFGPPPRV